MQVTIDIPEAVYREIEQQAQRERKSAADVLLERARAGAPSAEAVVPAKRGRITVPLISSDQPGSFDPGEGGIYDYVEFP